MIVVDTNIVLRLVQVSHPSHPVANRALASLVARDTALLTTTQTIAEFWAVARTPMAKNGLGFTSEQANQDIARLRHLFHVIGETDESQSLLKALLARHDLSRAQRHDAWLVSVMQAHGLFDILTFATEDFARFKRIEAVHPGDVG